jgi:hypothetical protein
MCRHFSTRQIVNNTLFRYNNKNLVRPIMNILCPFEAELIVYLNLSELFSQIVNKKRIFQHYKIHLNI